MRVQVAFAAACLATVLSGALRSQTPTPDAIATRDRQMAELAVDTAKRPQVDPIPLRAGSRVVGAIYDQFLLGVAVARAAAASGSAVDAAAVQASAPWRSHRMVIVALPIDCDGRADHPVAVRFSPGMTIPVRLPDPPPPVRGNDSHDLLPGVTVPDDALVAQVATMPLVNAHVDIDYAAPFCQGAAATVSVAVSTVPGSAAAGINGVKMPEASSASAPTTVRLQGLLDLDGHLRFLTLVQGPADLEASAAAALASRRFTPSSINGVPTPLWMGVPVVFTSTGAPGPMALFSPPLAGANTFTSTARVATPAGPVSATPPPAFPTGRADQLRARLAIELGSGDAPAPASLDDDGSRRHGMFFDRFVVQAIAARGAMASGHALDPLAPPADLVAKNGVVIAVPVNCGHPVVPTSIQIGDDRGMVRPVAGSISTTALREMLPAVTLPDGTIGQAITASDGVNLFVTIHYGEAVCGGSGDSVALTVRRDPVHVVAEPARPTTPASQTMSGPVVVHVQGLIDLTGVPRYLAAADGPPELAEAAVASGSQWRLQPTRMNGAPIPTTISLAITFVPANAPATAAGSTAPSTGPAMTMSSTVGGRLTHDTTTPDVPGLDASTSKCGAATDESYGTAPASPVKVGGGAAAGPAREQQYMSALRGPAGQGLHFARLGSLMGPDKTILDAYEVSYTGLPQAVRIYVDEYRTETLQAPRGFTCAAPLDIK